MFKKQSVIIEESFQYTLKSLSSFNTDQLNEIQVKTDFLLKSKERKKIIKTGEVDDTLLYEALKMELKEEVSENIAPYGVFKKNNSYPTYLTKKAILDAFIDDSFIKPKKVERLAIYRIIVHCIIKDFQEKGYLCRLSTIISAFDHCNSYFENAFPGYIKSGMANTLIKSLTRGHRNAKSL